MTHPIDGHHPRASGHLVLPSPELFTALAKAQANMGAALKDSKNPHFRSDYASLQSCLDAALPALNAEGITLTQHPGMDGGDVVVTTVLLHSSGQHLASTIRCPFTPGRNAAQAMGSMITYLRRYAVLAVCGLAPADDDGQSLTQPRGERQSTTRQLKTEIESIHAPEKRGTVLAGLGLATSTVDAFLQTGQKKLKVGSMSNREWLDFVTWLKLNNGIATINKWAAEQGE